jgi:RNA polymerase sigma-70 factor (ECF subfamily)
MASAGPLTAAFLRELDGGSGSFTFAEKDSPDLEDRLTDACERARAVFPKLTLENGAFAAHLGRAISRWPPGTSPSVSDVPAADLFLVCACLNGIPRAVETFRIEHRTAIRTIALRMLPSHGADDFEQRLFDLLLVGSDEGGAKRPKLDQFAGRAPLGRWIGVIADRLAIDLYRTAEVDQRVQREMVDELADRAASPELDYLKDRYRETVREALREALATLNERDQILIRLHFVSGASVGAIGRTYHVSQSTASRWLAHARDQILSALRERLRERLSVSATEVDSLVVLVASQLDVSLSGMLQVGQP